MNDIERQLTTMLRDRAEDCGSSADAWGRIDARTRRMDRRRRLIPLAVAAAVLVLVLVVVSLAPRPQVDLVPVSPGGDVDLSVLDQPPVPVEALPDLLQELAADPFLHADFGDANAARLAQQTGDIEFYVMPGQPDRVCLFLAFVSWSNAGDSRCASPEGLSRRGALLLPAQVVDGTPRLAGLIPDGYTTAIYVSPSNAGAATPPSDVVNNTFFLTVEFPVPDDAYVEVEGPRGVRRVRVLLGPLAPDSPAAPLAVLAQPPVSVQELPEPVRSAARGPQGEEALFDMEQVRLAQRSASIEVYVVPRENDVCLQTVAEPLAAATCRPLGELVQLGGLVVQQAVQDGPTVVAGLVPDGYTTAIYVDPELPEDEAPTAEVIDNTFVLTTTRPVPTDTWIEVTGPAGTIRLPAG